MKLLQKTGIPALPPMVVLTPRLGAAAPVTLFLSAPNPTNRQSAMGAFPCLPPHSGTALTAIQPLQ
jgi:hypothetical protein